MEDSDAKVFKEAFTSIRSSASDRCKASAARHHRSREEARCGLKASSRHRDASIADRNDDLRDDEGNRLAAAWRGFLAGVVRKKLKLKLNSEKIDGTRVYRVDGADSAKSSGRQSKRRTA
jgi:Protein of unknown function (DUF3489)